MKITKRQLRRIIREETQYAGNLEDVAAAAKHQYDAVG